MLLGTLSWSRIISASTPPRQKKTKVRTRYMIPIRLWSVVVTQSTQRLVLRGAVTLVAMTWGTGLRTSSRVIVAMCLLVS